MTEFTRYKDMQSELSLGAVGVHCRVKLTKGKTIGGLADLSTGLTLPGSGVDVVTGETGWFHNIVTNNGLNKLADTIFSDATIYCHCGTGTATEAATDTALGTFVAATSTLQSSSSSVQSSAPYYASYTRTFRFSVGAAEGNIAEVGFSEQNTTGDLFSRARVKDGGGSPTTITVLSDEWLDVTYEFRLYPDHILSGGGADDGTGTITITGVSYDYVIRPANVNSSTYWSASGTRAQFITKLSAWAQFYDSSSTLGAATSNPTNLSGSQAASPDSAVSAATYSAGTYTRDISLQIGLNDGNASGGVGAMMFNTGMGTYQISFDPVVPKDATKVWTFVTNLAWTRATIP